MAAKRETKKTDALLNSLDTSGLSTYGANQSDNAELIAAKEAEIAALRRELAQISQTGSIAPHDGKWYLGSFVLTRRGIIPPTNMSLDEADILGYALKGLDNATQFWIGDWANFYLSDTKNNQELGEEYRQLALRFDMEVKTIRNNAYVARTIPLSLRRDDVSWSHHALVAGYEDVAELLQMAFEENMSVSQLRAFLQEGNAKSQNPVIAEENLLSSKHMPKLNLIRQLYDATKKGNAEAKQKLLQELEAMRQWLDNIESELD